MTPKKEDYLKIILELGGKDQKVSNKKIAHGLNIAAGSVTEMVGKLVKDGLVEHTPYSGTKLTPAGTEIAECLVRRHRLWETFLMTKLGYKLSEVHDDAEVLEHGTSEILIDRLDAFLGYPTKCPHGGIIPKKDGSYAEGSQQMLAQAQENEILIIDRFIDNQELLNYIDELDLQIGNRVKVLKKAPFEGPITLENLTTNEVKQIGYKAGHYIFVK